MQIREEPSYMCDDISDNEIISVMAEDTINEVEHEMQIREEPFYMYDDIIDKHEPEQKEEIKVKQELLTHEEPVYKYEDICTELIYHSLKHLILPFYTNNQVL